MSNANTASFAAQICASRWTCASKNQAPKPSLPKRPRRSLICCSVAGFLGRITLTIAVLCSLLPGQRLDSVEFIDIAKESGLTMAVSFGNVSKNSYLLETTGTGGAIFDFDSDGDNDVFVVNGVTLDEYRDGAGRPSFLYRNEGDGSFTEVAQEAGLSKAGWGQGVCVGDYDNDGAPDLLVTYHGVDAL